MLSQLDMETSITSRGLTIGTPVHSQAHPAPHLSLRVLSPAVSGIRRRFSRSHPSLSPRYFKINGNTPNYTPLREYWPTAEPPSSVCETAAVCWLSHYVRGQPNYYNSCFVCIWRGIIVVEEKKKIFFCSLSYSLFSALLLGRRSQCPKPGDIHDAAHKLCRQDVERR